MVYNVSMLMRYGICDCGKWGDEPKGFDELRHFLKCECGQMMNLTRGNPKEAAYRDIDKITVKFVSQDQS